MFGGPSGGRKVSALPAFPGPKGDIREGQMKGQLSFFHIFYFTAFNDENSKSDSWRSVSAYVVQGTAEHFTVYEIFNSHN